ncbi:MAG: 4-(cytidine 5'-diphospho)-2-C-methyl-D-erythritol kinase [Leptospiraceae bacterium]|nr:4-(cytidine 5'-diphospho)-2-C-methyl-D-erythritol kinase [Leptospiraceae bacterium]
MLSKAKINLGLKVLFKRPDNYHEINSIMLKINWGDDILFEPIETKKFELISQNELQNDRKKLYNEVSEIGDYTKNILYKTYTLSKTENSKVPGVRIHLTKRIPPGGGLGGGSSNAASLLSFLFAKPDLNTSMNLVEIASKVGADVPFFLKEGSAIASGIGEILDDIEISQGYGVLAIPTFTINTAESFKNLNLTLQNNPTPNMCNILSDDLKLLLKNADWAELKDKLVNDFESYAFRIYPKLKSLKEDFNSLGCSYASMTGTGSCIYGLVKDFEAQKEVYDSMVLKYPFYQFIKFTF